MAFTGCFKNKTFQIYVVLIELITIVYYFILALSEYTDYNQNKILTFVCIYLVASVILSSLIYSIISPLFKLFERYQKTKNISKVIPGNSNLGGFLSNKQSKNIIVISSFQNSAHSYNSVINIEKLDCKKEDEKVDYSEISERLPCSEVAEGPEYSGLGINDYD